MDPIRQENLKASYLIWAQSIQNIDQYELYINMDQKFLSGYLRAIQIFLASQFH